MSKARGDITPQSHFRGVSMNNKKDAWWSTARAAKEGGASEATVQKWCRLGKIEGAVQDGKGRPWRIPPYAKPPKNYRKKRD